MTWTSDPRSADVARTVGPFTLFVRPVAHWFEWCVYDGQGYPLRDEDDRAVEGQCGDVVAAKAAAEEALKLRLLAWAEGLS